jgi:thiamine-phosphate pyrophosphorylase
VLLYYITNRHAFTGSERERRLALLKRIAAAARAAVDYIQLREKDLSPRELEALANEAVKTVRVHSTTTRMLINQHTDIALASGADGVHLPAGSLAPSEVRTLWLKATDRVATIAVSAHGVEEVRYAEAHGADFAVLAPIFEKPHTATAALGLETLVVACCAPKSPDNTESAPVRTFPVLALGGVNLRNARSCRNAGAAGIAGIRLFQSGDLAETVRTLRALNAKSGAIDSH